MTIAAALGLGPCSVYKLLRERGVTRAIADTRRMRQPKLAPERGDTEAEAQGGRPKQRASRSATGRSRAGAGPLCRRRAAGGDCGRARRGAGTSISLLEGARGLAESERSGQGPAHAGESPERIGGAAGGGAEVGSRGPCRPSWPRRSSSGTWRATPERRLRRTCTLDTDASTACYGSAGSSHASRDAAATGRGRDGPGRPAQRERAAAG